MFSILFRTTIFQLSSIESEASTDTNILKSLPVHRSLGRTLKRSRQWQPAPNWARRRKRSSSRWSSDCRESEEKFKWHYIFKLSEKNHFHWRQIEINSLVGLIRLKTVTWSKKIAWATLGMRGLRVGWENEPTGSPPYLKKRDRLSALPYLKAY